MLQSTKTTQSRVKASEEERKQHVTFGSKRYVSLQRGTHIIHSEYAHADRGKTLMGIPTIIPK
jgi:hypothetical protein